MSLMPIETPGLRRVEEAEFLQPVEHHDGLLEAEAQVAVLHQRLHALLLQQAVDERHVRRQVIVEDHAAHGRVQELLVQLNRLGVRYVLIVVRVRQVDHFAGVAHANRREQFDFARFERHDHFFGRSERAAFALRLRLGLRHVVDAEHHVLRRHRQRIAVGRRQDVVRAEHQHRRFHLRLGRKRNVHRHLVAVEVRVERGAHKRMDADRLAFDERRLERLDAEPVQRRSAVQQHGMLADHVLENVPDDRFLRLDQFLGLLDRGAMAGRFEPVIDERLEELERHLLRQAALVKLQFRSDDDDRAARIVHALAEQVLAEAALLALERVGKRLERAVVRSAQHAAAAAVVEQRVDGFLQHALLVADDHVRRVQLHQLLQPVVAVDHAAIEVVQIGRREAAAVERHQRAQLRRKHRNHVENHPLGLVAALAERFEHLQALRVLDPLLQARIDFHLLAKFSKTAFRRRRGAEAP